MSDHDRALVREALEEVVKAAGTQSAVAALLSEATGENIRTGNLYYWLKQGVVPERFAPTLERAFGIDRRRLCPGWRNVWPELDAEGGSAGPKAVADRPTASEEWGERADRRGAASDRRDPVHERRHGDRRADRRHGDRRHDGDRRG